MNCLQIKENFVDYLSDELNESIKKSIQTHLAGCQACRAELEDLNEIWIKLGILPQQLPDPIVRKNFYAMLESYKEGLQENRTATSPAGLFQRLLLRISFFRPALQFAMVPVLLLIGILAGFMFSNGNNESKTKSHEIIALTSEANQMRQMISLSLLNENSPSDRISGIKWSTKVVNPDKKIMEQLFDLLNNDPNINVRLSVLDALYLFSGNPEVKEALVNSIKFQDSPLVQVTLIDLISEIREKKAIKALKILMEKKDVNSLVREKANQSIKELM